MQAIAANPPDVIVTSNPGCQLQMLAGVRAAGLEGKVRVMQLAEFVREFGGGLFPQAQDQRQRRDETAEDR